MLWWPLFGEVYSGIIKLQILLIKEGIQLFIDTTENESLVHRARNVSVGRFMQKTDCEYFMFIDADIDFDPAAVVRLVKSGHDLSVACYPKKVVMWDQAADAVKKGDDRDMSMLSSSLVINFGAVNRPIQDGFIEILDGYGFHGNQAFRIQDARRKFLNFGVRMIIKTETLTTITHVLTV